MPNKAELIAGLIDANGDVLADNLDNVSVAFSEITSKPTTLSGYGITDGLTASDITGKADLASPTFTGTPAAPTATTGTNTTQLATTAFVQTELSALVDSAPASLDTLNELAAALGDDANFSTTVTNSIATKAPLASPTFTGTVTTPGLTSNGNITIDQDTYAGVTFSTLSANRYLAADDNGALTFGTGTTLGSGTKYFHIDTNGKVGINESSPSAPLHITTTSQGTLPALQADADNLLIEDSTAGITLMGATNGGGMLAFGDTADADVGRIFYYHVSDYMGFWTNAAERMRLEADGDLHADGDVIAYSTTISDERLKTNIQGIENAVAKVSQLNGYTFEYKADGKVSAGVIAQEVESVLPEAVSEKQLPLKTDDDQEYKVVNYDALHGLLIEAVKELAARVEALEAK